MPNVVAFSREKEKSLHEIADELNSFVRRDDDIRLRQAYLLAEVKMRYHSFAYDVHHESNCKTFREWVTKNVNICWKEVQRLVKFAESPDPRAALNAYRESQKKAQAMHREAQKRNLRKSPTIEELITSIKHRVNQLVSAVWQERGLLARPDKELCAVAESALVALKTTPEKVIATYLGVDPDWVHARLRVTDPDPVVAFRHYLLKSSKLARAEVMRGFIEEFRIELGARTAPPAHEQLELVITDEVMLRDIELPF